ncbi:hypothetical protein SLIQ_00915 [Serratia liquefaciens FK01]|nr:hypothetical protein SLIQ_00915 [Serratia liquefaciens FK01]
MPGVKHDFPPAVQNEIDDVIQCHEQCHVECQSPSSLAGKLGEEPGGGDKQSALTLCKKG